MLNSRRTSLLFEILLGLVLCFHSSQAKDLLIRPTDDFNVKILEAEDGDVVYLAPGTHSNTSYQCPGLTLTFTGLPGNDLPNLPAPFHYKKEDDGEQKTLRFISLEIPTRLSVVAPDCVVVIENCTIGNSDYKAVRGGIIVKNSVVGNATYSTDKLNISDSMEGKSFGSITINANISSLNRITCGSINVGNPGNIEEGYIESKVIRMENVQCDDFSSGITKTAIFNSHLRKTGNGGTIHFRGKETVCMFSKLTSNEIYHYGGNLVALFHNDIRGRTRFEGPCQYISGNNFYQGRAGDAAQIFLIRNHRHKMEIINNSFSWSGTSSQSRVFWDVEGGFKMDRIYFANNYIQDGHSQNGNDFFASNNDFVRNSVVGDGNYCNRRGFSAGGFTVMKASDMNPGSSEPYFLNSDGTVSNAGAGGGGPFYFGEEYKSGMAYVITTFLDKTSIIKPFDSDIQADFIVVK